MKKNKFLLIALIILIFISVSYAGLKYGVYYKLQEDCAKAAFLEYTQKDNPDSFKKIEKIETRRDWVNGNNFFIVNYFDDPYTYQFDYLNREQSLVLYPEVLGYNDSMTRDKKKNPPNFADYQKNYDKFIEIYMSGNKQAVMKTLYEIKKGNFTANNKIKEK